MTAVAPPRLFAPAPELTPVLGDRGLFSGLEPLVYANHAGISPHSILVKKAVDTLMLDYGRRGAAAYPTWAAQRTRLREKLAALVGASPDEIAFTQNTTRGVSDVALSIDWKRGDRVLVFRGEFPSNVTPWQRAAELFGLEIVMLESDELRTDEARALDRIRDAARAGLRLVAVSAVEFSTGHRVPLRAISDIAKGAGALVFVDAVQACGLSPIDAAAAGVDFLSCGSHKLLMGVEGAGFVYASREAAARLVPRTAGWLSHELAVDFLFEGEGKLRYDKGFKRTIDFLEGGNVSATAFAALEASLDAILHLGRAAIFDHVQKFNDAVEAGARSLGFTSLRSEDPERRSGALCLVAPAGVDVVRVHAEITNLGVACALPDGKLRLSPHWPNALDETEQVLLSLEEALARARA
jgi:selenocysteine lyase/cysteine desulfurase